MCIITIAQADKKGDIQSMTTILKEFFNKVAKHTIKTDGKVDSKGVTLHIDIQGVPETNRCLMMITFYKDGVKSAESIPFKSFGRFMFMLEKALLSAAPAEIEGEYDFKPIQQEIPAGVLEKLSCHRCFIIPNDSVYDVLEEISDLSFSDPVYKGMQVERYFIDIQYCNHDCRLEVY